MKLGTFVRPYSMDPAELDKVFAPLKEMGFTACQLAYKPEVFLKEDAEAIRAAADRNGIEISAHFIGFRDPYTSWDLKYAYLMSGLTSPTFRAMRMEYLMKGCEFVKWLGITDLIIHAGNIPNNPFDPNYTALVACIRVLAKRCKDLGLNLLFETGAETAVSLLRMINDVGMDNLFINFDTGNGALYGNYGALDAVYMYGHLIRNVHVKDGLPPTDPDKLGLETALGDGVVDFDGVMKKLFELNYDRFMIIEREVGTGEQQKLDVLKAKKYIEDMLAKR